MKIIIRENGLFSIVITLFCMESCCCIRIDREDKDIIDTLANNHCNDISTAFVEGKRCRCSLGAGSSIASIVPEDIECIINRQIDRSK